MFKISATFFASDAFEKIPSIVTIPSFFVRTRLNGFESLESDEAKKLIILSIKPVSVELISVLVVVVTKV
jgi:hypothetical protein